MGFKAAARRERGRQANYLGYMCVCVNKNKMVLPMQNRAGFPRMKASILIPRFSVEALSKGLVASYFLPFGTFALERCSIHASPTLLVSSGLETNLSDAPQFLLCQLY